MKRPLIPVALFYVAGILAGRYWAAPFSVLFGVAFLLLITAVASARARPFLLWPLILLVGWINFSQRTAILANNDLRNLLPRPDHVLVRGFLADAPQHHVRLVKNQELQTTTARLEVSAININGRGWQRAFGNIVTHTTGSLAKDYFGFQSVEIEGDIGPPGRSVAEGLFDYPEHLRGQGIYYLLHVKDPGHWRNLATSNRPPLTERFAKWSQGTLQFGLPAIDEAFLLECALTLGQKSTLSEEFFEPFIRAATYHIFAVDGLRIAILSGILIALLRVLSAPRWLCGVVAAPIIIFYAAMTGWPPSAMRAIVMALVVFLGWCLHRPLNLLNSLALAAIVILLYDPRQLFQPGFQLSVGVVLCIILTVPFFDDVGKRLLRADPLLPEELRPWWQRTLRTSVRWFINLFLTSMAAWLGSIPLVAYYFHLITPMSGPANVLAVPLCVLVLISNISSLLLGAWFPFGTEIFNHAGWFLMKCIETTSHWSASWPGAYYYVPMPSVFTILVYYIILISTLTGWLFRAKGRVWRIAAVAVPALTWCILWLHQRPVTQLSVLPLDGGHAIYVRSPGNGNQWLIDCGNEADVDEVTKPFLRAQGVNRISNFLLTHGESAYTGGAGLVAELFRPKNIYASPLVFRSPTYRDFQRTNHLRTEWKPPLNLGDLAGPWTVLHPAAEEHLPKAEDNALVLRGEIAGVSILLLSDLGRAGQRALLERTNNLRADIAVAALPSEGEPLSDMLLDAIQPRVVIIADAIRPATRRASRTLKERLARRNIPIIYASDSGAVTIELRSGDWTLRTMDGARLSSRQPATSIVRKRPGSVMGQRPNSYQPGPAAQLIGTKQTGSANGAVHRPGIAWLAIGSMAFGMCFDRAYKETWGDAPGWYEARRWRYRLCRTSLGCLV